MSYQCFIPATLLFVLACGWAPLPVFGLAPGDPVRGEKIYDRCIACHAIDRDRTGPRHAGLFGRRAGSVPDFTYSAAMKKAGVDGLIWNEDTLDKFLENPTKYIPGTRMGYAGINNSQERADLVAYVQKATPPKF
jgi:cytochrome c